MQRKITGTASRRYTSQDPEPETFAEIMIAIVRHAAFFCQRGRSKRALEHGFDVDVLRVSRLGTAAAFSSIICVSRSWSSEPQFTPMRTGLSCSSATRAMMRKFSSRRLLPTLPGLIRYFARARAHSGYFVSSRWPL